MGPKHKRTLKAVFEDPVRSNIAWRDIEAMLEAAGSEITEGAGSRVRIALNNVNKMNPVLAGKFLGNANGVKIASGIKAPDVVINGVEQAGLGIAGTFFNADIRYNERITYRRWPDVTHTAARE